MTIFGIHRIHEGFISLFAILQYRVCILEFNYWTKKIIFWMSANFGIFEINFINIIIIFIIFIIII